MHTSTTAKHSHILTVNPGLFRFLDGDSGSDAARPARHETHGPNRNPVEPAAARRPAVAAAAAAASTTPSAPIAIPGRAHRQDHAKTLRVSVSVKFFCGTNDDGSPVPDNSYQPKPESESRHEREAISKPTAPKATWAARE